MHESQLVNKTLRSGPAIIYYVPGDPDPRVNPGNSVRTNTRRNNGQLD